MDTSKSAISTSSGARLHVVQSHTS